MHRREGGDLRTEEKQDTKSADILDSVSIATFDLDGRIFRTLWHSLVRTPDVALAGMTGDFSRYISPVRVFVALFSFQFVVASLFGTPLNGSLEDLASALSPEAVEAWLATGRNAAGETPTAAEVDAAIESWGAMLLWPITIITSLPYLGLLKLYRPSIPLWGHVQVYLASTNASFVVMIAAIPTLAFDMVWFYVSLIVALCVYLFCTAWLIVRFYSHSAAGAAVRLLGLGLMIPVTMLLAAMGQLLATAFTLDTNFDLSLIELYLPENR